MKIYYTQEEWQSLWPEVESEGYKYFDEVLYRLLDERGREISMVADNKGLLDCTEIVQDCKECYLVHESFVYFYRKLCKAKFVEIFESMPSRSTKELTAYEAEIRPTLLKLIENV